MLGPSIAICRVEPGIATTADATGTGDDSTLTGEALAAAPAIDADAADDDDGGGDDAVLPLDATVAAGRSSSTRADAGTPSSLSLTATASGAALVEFALVALPLSTATVPLTVAFRGSVPSRAWSTVDDTLPPAVLSPTTVSLPAALPMAVAPRSRPGAAVPLAVPELGDGASTDSATVPVGDGT